MKQNGPLSAEIKKRRQLLLVLPLLILPFVTLAFWALGGGGGEVAAPAQAVNIGHEGGAGLNTVVPGAELAGRPEDKMSLYADADRRARLRKEADREAFGAFRFPDTVGRIYEADSDSFGSAGADLNSQRVEQKLADLRAMVESAAKGQQPGPAAVVSVDPAGYGPRSGAEYGGQSKETKEALDQLGVLKALIAGPTGTMQEADQGQDKDMIQINTMLDKILAIQASGNSGAPVGSQDSLTALSRQHKGRVYSVSLPEEADGIDRVSLLQPADTGQSLVNGDTDPSNYRPADSVRQPYSLLDREQGIGAEVAGGAFYDIDAEKEAAADHDAYAMPAVIAETQILVDGAAVKLRLTSDLYMDGHLIPAGNFVYGICSLSGERLKIVIGGIRLENRLFPVHLTVYDLDGIEGVHIPGAISREASKEGADRALQGVQMMSLDPGLAAQAAAAGVEATRGLLRKKVKRIRVTVKAGYPVLLMDGGGTGRDYK